MRRLWQSEKLDLIIIGKRSKGQGKSAILVQTPDEPCQGEKLPIVIHSRDAAKDTLDIAKRREVIGNRRCCPLLFLIRWKWPENI